MDTPIRAVELERKYAIDVDAPVPSLGDAVVTGPGQTTRLRAVYFDTPDFALSRAKRTLRRREGGEDQGWHLKLPGDGDARTEVRTSLDASPSPLLVPSVLRAEVADVVGTAPLLPVALLSTHRVVTPLLDPGSGRVVGEVADDTVEATRYGDGHAMRWRELEAEVLSGDDAGTTDPVLLLEIVTERFAAAGVKVSTSPSKVSAVLGDAVSRAENAALDENSTAAEVVGAYIAAQVGVLQARASELADPASDAVHKSRVATRRLRSALAEFEHLFSPKAPKALRAKRLRRELGWYAGVLGAPRDAEVIRDRILDDLHTVPDPLDAETEAALEAKLVERHRVALESLLEVLDTPRQVKLMERLVRFVTEPPFADVAHRRATKVLPEVISSTAETVERVHEEALAAAPGSTEALHLLHETRKKAKRARYITEASAPALGESAVDLAARWEEVTETLGLVQDGVVAEAVIRELSQEITSPDTPVGQALDHLAAQERERAVQASTPGTESDDDPE